MERLFEVVICQNRRLAGGFLLPLRREGAPGFAGRRMILDFPEPSTCPESGRMLSALRRFLNDMSASEDHAEVGEDEVQLAAAALLFHVIAVDGMASEEERAKLEGLLERRFDLGPDEARSLVSAAEEADAEAVDLYGFTSILKRRLDEADRERIVEMMWKLVFADGAVHEFEDNVVWRVAELLAVPSQTRIRLKQAARGHAG
jgi:uncharacterized tellurite resistance protein B-like protein